MDSDWTIGSPAGPAWYEVPTARFVLQLHQQLCFVRGRSQTPEEFLGLSGMEPGGQNSCLGHVVLLILCYHGRKFPHISQIPEQGVTIPLVFPRVSSFKRCYVFGAQNRYRVLVRWLILITYVRTIRSTIASAACCPRAFSRHCEQTRS